MNYIYFNLNLEKVATFVFFFNQNISSPAIKMDSEHVSQLDCRIYESKMHMYPS